MHDRLTGKLSRIRSGAYSPSDFIIADAKDAEMGGGIGALGTVRLADGTERPATSSDYRQAMTEMMASGQILPIRFPDPGKCLADDSSPKTVALTLTLTPFRSPTLPQASPRVSAPTASQS